MNRIFRTKWLILSRSVVFNVSIIIWLVSIIGFPLIIYLMSQNENDVRFDILKDAFTFPIVFNTISVLELCIPLHLMSLTIIVLICQEFDFKTYRLHLLNGSSRFELWLNTLLLTLVLSIFIMLLSFIISFGFGISIDKSIVNLDSIKPFRWHLILFFQAFAYFNFAITLSLLFRKTGIVILVYILWFGAIERTLAQIFNFNAPFHWYPVGDLMPGKSIEELSRFKVLEALGGVYIYHNGYEILKQSFAILWCSASILFNYSFYKRLAY